MLWFFYNLLFPMVFLLMLPRFLLRMARRGGYKKHFEQRVGVYGHGTAERLNEVRRIWIHAVSVGEIHVALRFIRAYREKNRDAHFVVSTATSTAHALGNKELDSRDVLIYFPIDLPLVMKRAFDAIRPRKLILVECEFWPNLIRQARKREIPVSLINGRISDSSFKGYMKLRPFIRRLLEMIDPVCVQSQQDAERMIAMGARLETVHTLGTAKYDLPPPAADAAAAAETVLRNIGVPEKALILLGGSTWPGEEAALCEIYKKLREKHPELFLVLVPRHAERRDKVIRAVESHALSYALRSNVDERPLSRSDLLIVDTTGELMSFYAAADVVFIGKSLCEHGGQNPIEPALFGKAIVTGPNMENFPGVMDDFLEKDALIRLQDIQSLEQTIGTILSDPTVCGQLGAAARQVVESRCGVIGKMVEEVQ